MRRTASTAKPATSRTPTRTSPGSRPRAVAARTIRICDLRRCVSRSSQIHREALEIGERAVVERALVRGAHDHAGRLTRLQRFLPTGCTEAPAIAGFEAGKAEFRHRCG